MNQLLIAGTVFHRADFTATRTLSDPYTVFNPKKTAVTELESFGNTFHEGLIDAEKQQKTVLS